MAKNQAKHETQDDTEVWLADDAGDFGEASNDAEMPVKARMQMRHKIEDLLESRRLKAQIADYESFDVDDSEPQMKATRRLH